MNRHRLKLCGLLLGCLLACLSSTAPASPATEKKPITEMPSVITVPLEAQPSDHFDPEAATKAYLAEIRQRRAPGRTPTSKAVIG